MKPEDKPLISVVIPTYNRAELLEKSLESLTAQSLPKGRFEVIVIDDGSPDNTREVCEGFADRLTLRYQRQENSGISAAKNMGVFMSRAPIVFFFDDDDVADPRLLEEHVRTHARHPQENVAVLGYTTWHPSLEVNRLMHFVTDIGGFLFSYGNLEHGQILDFTYFWGGRSSCKKSFLTRHGVFNQLFRFGSEDIELGYRLSKHGLTVIYNKNAKSYMIRPLTYEQFCQRCIKQGRSQYHFSRMHPDPVIRKYCMVEDAERMWAFARLGIDDRIQRVKDIERVLDEGVKPERRKELLDELGMLYRWTFNALKIKGVVEEMQASAGDAPGTTPCSGHPRKDLGKDIVHLSRAWGKTPPTVSCRGHVLIVDPLLPMYDRASGSLRLFEIMKALQRMGFHLTYIARSPDHADEYVPLLQKMGVEVYAGDPLALQEFWPDVLAPHLDVEKILKSRRFDYVILSFWHIARHYLPLVRKFSPSSRVIIDTVDIHFLREIREAEMKRDRALLEKALKNKEQELAVYQEGDRIWVVTEDDKKVIQGLVNKPIDVVPNIHKEVPWTKEFEQTKDLLFVGNFNHKPNIDAVLFLHKKIFPVIRKGLPGVRVYIVGNNPPAQIRRLNSEDFIVTGYVEDLEPYLKDARISISPLTYGAGMKGKVGEALSWGLPVVTTTIGAEGMDLEDGVTAMIADDPKEFARKVIELYLDRDSWTRLSKNGKKHVEQRWSPSAIQKRIESSLLHMKGFTGGHVSAVLMGSLPNTHIREALDALDSFIDAPGDTVVVASDLHEGTSMALLEMQHDPLRPRKVKVLATRGDRSVKLWNRAMAVCEGELAVLCRRLDPADAKVIRSLVSYALEHPQADVVTPRMPRLEDSPAFPGAAGRATRPLPFMIVRHTAFEAVGGLDSRIHDDHLAWCDYVMRASERGLQAACPKEPQEEAAQTAASEGATPGTQAESDWRYFSEKWGLSEETLKAAAGSTLALQSTHAAGDLFCSFGDEPVPGSPSHIGDDDGRPVDDQEEPLPTGLTSIIVLCFNGLDYTRQCLESVEAFTPEPHEIILVDNGSTDGTRAFLEEFAKTHEHVRLVLNEENLGYAAGNNQAIRLAEGDYVVLLNNDVVVTEGWLRGMIRHMERDKDVGMVGPVSNSVSGRQLVHGASYGRDMQRMHEFASQVRKRNAHRAEPFMRLVGFCLLVKKEVLDIIGGLDEGYLTGNYEDDDLCIRSVAAGYKNLIAHDVFVHHYGSMTFKVNSLDHRRTMDANLAYFLKKWEGVVSLVSDDVYRLHLDKAAQVSLLNRWGEAAFQEGDVLRALKIFERAAAIDPKNTETLNNIGVALWQLGEVDSAVMSFQAALAIKPDDEHALSNLTDALEAGASVDLLQPETRRVLEGYDKKTADRAGGQQAARG